MFLRIVFFTLFTGSIVYSQPVNPTLTTEKKRLLVLTTDENASNDAIEKQLSKIVAEVASNLGRYEVIDRNQLAAIIGEQRIQQSGIIEEKDVVELGKLTSAKEAMRVSVTQFSQRGVPPDDQKENDDDDDDRGFWEMVVYESVKGAIRMATTPNEDEPYPYNIQTILDATIVLLDIESGKTVKSFPVSVIHTGGARGESLAKTLNVVRWNVSRSLRELYTITSEILAVDGNKTTLFLGSDMGVKRGTMYEIARLDRKKMLRDKEVIIPGESVGLVRVDRISGDASAGTIVRKWGRVKEGYKAVEMVRPLMFSPGFFLQYNFEHSGFDQGGFNLQLHPFGRISFQGFIGGGKIIDSRNRQDGMFTLGGGLTYRFLRTPKFNLSGTADVPFHFVFRPDDNGHSVTSLFVHSKLGLKTEIMLNRKLDIIFQAGFSGIGVHGNWQYSKGEGEDLKSFDAEWESAEPLLDASGMFLTIGIRFLTID